MYLVRLVYASRTTELNEKVIEDILNTARSNNQRTGITGALHFSSKYFLQCLEGTRSSVNMVYQNIMQDTRHADPIILTYDQVDERCFGSWSMAYVGEGIANKDLFFKYSGKLAFNPYEMSGRSAELMLRELVDVSGA